MKRFFTRTLMTLAIATMEERRRPWGLAMQAELEVAIEAGGAFRFALGCFFAAVLRLPTHAGGQFGVTAHALALGLMVPLAGLQIGCAVFDFPFFVPNGSVVDLIARQSPLTVSVYRMVVPSVIGLLLLLGIGHLRMAWLILEHDWPRVMKTASLTLAATVTVVPVMALLYLDITQALLQAAILAAELVMLAAMARWHAELPQRVSPAETTG
ncbi:hypothetical protein [Sphingomonas sp. Leaf67]|uniref:hypothetical protein n=1 Tax=Sphingomonas sp. Leaf67 TaxID=1736230 RepID=UPI000A419630|nr:hypothetical protein [Sphingomonas sp. Leaf67]